MNPDEVTFSIDHHDRDGDVIEKGIYLHLGNIALRFKNLNDLQFFSGKVADIVKEITNDHHGY